MMDGQAEADARPRSAAMAPSSHQGQIDWRTPLPMATTNGAVAFDVTSTV